MFDNRVSPNTENLKKGEHKEVVGVSRGVVHYP